MIKVLFAWWCAAYAGLLIAIAIAAAPCTAQPYLLGDEPVTSDRRLVHEITPKPVAANSRLISVVSSETEAWNEKAALKAREPNAHLFEKTPFQSSVYLNGDYVGFLGSSFPLPQGILYRTLL